MRYPSSLRFAAFTAAASPTANKYSSTCGSAPVAAGRARQAAISSPASRPSMPPRCHCPEASKPQAISPSSVCGAYSWYGQSLPSRPGRPSAHGSPSSAQCPAAPRRTPRSGSRTPGIGGTRQGGRLLSGNRHSLIHLCRGSRGGHRHEEGGERGCRDCRAIAPFLGLFRRMGLEAGPLSEWLVAELTSIVSPPP